MSEKNYEGYTEEEVAVALKTIRDICCCNLDSEGECMVECPFLNNTSRICRVTYDSPYQWSLNPFPPKSWTPFK